ncbi:hypothetical protein Lesp02_08720 [Lentzea sp. NBRC 105346]|uniref:pentapeptide repeat-containing protein n=1 Tax=Lentzea sp. NBRC 105346 TaxID=3032205 RepID=UPI0024A3DA71|nr:pentapeptide repeat-containing protein [Lentzea sp. NBRC 105346]GLZ28682.1 hypothetical protein Lesp02_08720 [Lentzea sp. NBRC 105346]
MLNRSDLTADCSRCAGLCCVAPAFAKSSDFAINKPAGKPCPNLRQDFRCGIHTQLRQKGFPGCTVFDCFGAGQQVVQITYDGADWHDQPRMLDTFPIMRNLHELLYYLAEARTFDQNPNLGNTQAEIEHLTNQSPDVLDRVDVDQLRKAVNVLLTEASNRRRKGLGQRDLRGRDLIGKSLRDKDLRGANLRGALLIGADLSGADLRLADVIGADFRGANLAGADLSETIFLTQAQLNAARGDRSTKLPASLEHPAHWR